METANLRGRGEINVSVSTPSVGMSNQRGCARRKGQKLSDDRRSKTWQAMAGDTLARSCPCMSMALVLSIVRLVAVASKRSGLTPLERVFIESRPGRVWLN